MRAYTPGVGSASHSLTAGDGVRVPQPWRRRRLPSEAEQARRVAWGKKYGKIMKELRAQWPK